MKENKGFVINIGIPSVVLILLVFVLSVFALLSIRASNSEEKLAEKTGDSIQQYYKADGEAEYALCYIEYIVKKSKIEELKSNLKNMNTSGQKELDNLQEVNLHLNDGVIFTGKQKDKLGTIAYSIFMEEGKYLEVSLALHGDRSVSVETWRMVKEPWDFEEFGEEIELWDGSVTIE